jgi:hypothetical protein
MASEYHVRGAKLGFLKQSAFATPQAASANFQTINADTSSINFDSKTMTDEFMFAGAGGLMTGEKTRYTDGVSDLKTLTYNLSMAKTLLAAHLVAAFQKVTEAASTPFAKQISPANAFIDFNGDAGYLWTLAFSPSGMASNDGIILEAALINDIEIAIDNMANGAKQLMTGAVTWIGNEMNQSQTLSGSWVASPDNASTFFNTVALPFTLDYVIGSTTVSGGCWRRFAMKLSNNVFAKCKTGGKVSQYGIAPTLTFTIDIPYTSANFAILASHQAGDNASISFYNGTGTTDGLLNIAFTKGTLTAPPMVYEGDYHAIRLEVRVDKPSAGFAADCIKYTDTIDGAY